MKLKRREIAFYTIWVFVIVVTAALLFAVWGIKRANENQMMPEEKVKKYKYHYMLIQKKFGDERSKSLYAGAKKAGEERDIFVENTEESARAGDTIQEMLKTAIDANVDGIIVEADDSTTVAELINQASEKNIPVATVGKDSGDSKRKCFVGIDVKQAGILYAERILEQYGNKPMNVTVLTDGKSADTRESVYREIEKNIKQSDIRVDKVDIQAENEFTSDEKIREIFLTQGEKTDVLVCLSELDTICAYKAAVDYNMVGKIKIIGYSAVEEVQEAIRKGIVDSSITFQANEIGEKAVQTLFALRNKKTVESYVNVTVQMIEKDNLQMYRKEENNERKR